jgi:hypothetical protein
LAHPLTRMVLPSSRMKNPVAIGLRAKTGRAICVVLSGSSNAPEVVKKFEMRLTDPKVPATFQPYHEVMELPWDESQRAARKYVKAIEAIARKAVAQLVHELKSQGFEISGVGIVGAADRDLARIGNFHIRAHAAEGLLFRQVLNLAAEANGLKWRLLADKNFDQAARAEFGSEAASVKQKVTDMRKEVAAPWRTEEKQAAIAAWLMLHQEWR